MPNRRCVAIVFVLCLWGAGGCCSGREAPLPVPPEQTTNLNPLRVDLAELPLDPSYADVTLSAFEENPSRYPDLKRIVDFMREVEDSQNELDEGIRELDEELFHLFRFLADEQRLSRFSRAEVPDGVPDSITAQDLRAVVDSRVGFLNEVKDSIAFSYRGLWWAFFVADGELTESDLVPFNRLVVFRPYATE